MKKRIKNKKISRNNRRPPKEQPRKSVTCRTTLKKVAAPKKIVEPVAPTVEYRRPPYFPSLTNDVVLGYQRHRVGAALPWDHERHPVRTAWAKLSNDIGPRESGRGIRSGM